jgi:hypothetical protein
MQAAGSGEVGGRCFGQSLVSGTVFWAWALILVYGVCWCTVYNLPHVVGWVMPAAPWPETCSPVLGRHLPRRQGGQLFTGLGATLSA